MRHSSWTFALVVLWSTLALAQQRAQSLSYGSLPSFTDEPDVAALAARLALPGR